tara:strand:- start:260 stop:949 length:690 start_codon:yes stop_codon:yes gene_type:complete
MLILGWDIGIKNLSYCLVEYTGNSNQPIEDVYTNCKIKLWGIVDLLETDISLPKNKQKKCKDLKLIEIGRTIKNKFDEISAFNTVDYVVIENQPVLKNPTMKSIQIMVFSYFLFKEQDPTLHTITDICLLNANNKMKVYKGDIDGDVLEKITKLKSKYSQNKKLAIVHTNLILDNLQESPVFIDMFNKSKKKDDYADSYLMTLFFISNRINKPLKIKKTKPLKNKKLSL